VAAQVTKPRLHARYRSHDEPPPTRLVALSAHMQPVCSLNKRRGQSPAQCAMQGDRRGASWASLVANLARFHTIGRLALPHTHCMRAGHVMGDPSMQKRTAAAPVMIRQRRTAELQGVLILADKPRLAGRIRYFCKDH